MILLFVLLEVVFVFTTLFGISVADLHHLTARSISIALSWVLSGLVLLFISVMHRKRHPRAAEIAWITLFGAIVLGLIFPKIW
jgi:hypothetical protein